MKIVCTSKGDSSNSEIDPRFGRASYFVIFDDESKTFQSVDNTSVGAASHGAGLRAAQTLLDFQPDVLITGNGPGGKAGSILERLPMRIFVGADGMTVQQALDAFASGNLRELQL